MARAQARSNQPEERALNAGIAAVPVRPRARKGVRLGVVVLALLLALAMGFMASRANAVFSGGKGLIVFSSDRDGDNEIYAMAPSGTGVVQLTNNTASDLEPALSPDGTKVAFVSDRDGNNEIYSMNVDGTNVVRLTNAATSETDPAWQSGGTLLT